MSQRETLQKHTDLLLGACLGILGLCIYLPRLGAFPLWDPWEPHYSQVAWEMQQHATWFDPIYRNANNWWSKPILMLWMLRASFSLLWDSRHSFYAPELYARLPFALTAVTGAVIHFDWVRRLFGRNVGALSAVMLMTSTQYLLIGRQVMVDMVLVASYASAMGYLTVGLFAAENSTRTKVTRMPMLMFWVCSALAVLAKGFVPPVMVVLSLASYALISYRPDALGNESDASRLNWRQGGQTGLLFASSGFAILWLRRQTSWPEHQRELAIALVVLVSCLAIFLGILRKTRPSRHVRALLGQMRVAWGLPLFLVIAAPWFLFMTVRHGWQYWQVFIFYHHLDRARGVIHLPSGSFEFYLRHLAFALFPWTGFAIAGIALFLGRCHPTRSVTERRNLFLLCSIAAPLGFLMTTGTKFGHYVFPILPTCTVIASAALVESMRPIQQRLPEGGTHHAGPSSSDTTESVRGSLAIFGFLAFLVSLVLLVDVRHDFRHLLRSFIYYFQRSTPFEYQPAAQFTILAAPFIAVAGSLVWARSVARWHVMGLAASGVVFACYLGWITMPAMGATYTYKPLLDAYRALAKSNDAIGQYCTWPQPERSVLFLSQNRVVHLDSDSATIMFLSRPGRRFVIVDRNRLGELKRVAKSIKVPLFVVSWDHAYARLVSNEPSMVSDANRNPSILGELPAETTPIDAQFAGMIQLRGWRVTPERLHPGDKLDVAFYYEAVGPIDQNYQIFVHGDSPTHADHRLSADHFPAQGTLPTRQWQEGRIIEDRFTLRVPNDYPHESFFLWTGFFLGDRRLDVTNHVAHDEFGRVRGPLVFVEQVKP